MPAAVAQQRRPGNGRSATPAQVRQRSLEAYRKQNLPGFGAEREAKLTVAQYRYPAKYKSIKTVLSNLLSPEGLSSICTKKTHLVHFFLKPVRVESFVISQFLEVAQQNAQPCVCS
ncbi:Acyl-Coa Dehydrogenase Family Member 11 [Manis pentadactyla]|nr:Acyl-Coa Dehydrogenase Family Member 11 [Manis pentadactyla]